MTDAAPSEVLVSREGGVGRLTLNRPQALHALSRTMCLLMTEALLQWRNDPTIKLVMIDHSGERGFCAGGDIRMLAESGAGDGVAAAGFLFDEYRLNHLLFTYDKPVAAFIDGIVMGGGVGISMPARYRVAGERTTYAMPETGIGLFPDVGGGWYLPRLPHHAGLWLGLTGARIKAADCLALGIATHFVAGADLPALKAAIVADPGAIETLLAKAAGDPGPAPITAVTAEIDRLFSGDSVEAIVEALNAEDSDWSRAQRTVLATRSPQSVKATFRQLRTGAAAADFAANMVMEYRLGVRLTRSADFIEGVRAVIVDKDNAPRWNPATFEGVSDAALDALFAPLAPQDEWTPLPEVSS